VIADDRERGAGVVERLSAMEGVEVVVRRLRLGDYLVDNRLLFERKALPDLVASIKEGRLFSQATRLATCPYRPVIVLEGALRDLEGFGMTRASIQGAIVTLTVVLNLPVLRALNPAETAGLIRFAADQVRRVIRGGVKRGGYRPRGKRARQLYILQGLPGLGPTRAARLLDRFGTLEAILSATPEALSETPGLGHATATRIHWLAHDPHAPYGNSP
jgi:ERCC4-type nuclease